MASLRIARRSGVIRKLRFPSSNHFLQANFPVQFRLANPTKAESSSRAA
jgi:hypothetical protein